ncbi:hypothetical protein [Streptomyces bicolor]|uniref:hypothetical protein n=1 Tax=Streptomyces bicolor TaxID=66874 RepID=UPI0006898546|nr:hypothetical protein [Streptomyces bicolor]
MANADTLDDRHDDHEVPPTAAEWDDLIADWDEIREGYHAGDASRAVLECARKVEASVAADAPNTAAWTLGLVLTGPYVIYGRPDAAAEARVLQALGAVERALGRTPCAHEEHPYEDLPLDDELADLRLALEALVFPERGDTQEAQIWACPQNLAGLARVFSDEWAPSGS